MYRRTGIMIMAALTVIGGLNLLSGFADKKDKNGEMANQRSVQGSVTDNKDNPVSGAVVYIKNAKTLQIRSFITKEQGTYYFHSLSPDVDYELHAESNGATSPNKTLSSFDSRKQATINLKLK
jgi:protocatechuate 3,4-dioxygenase beta subunit